MKRCPHCNLRLLTPAIEIWEAHTHMSARLGWDHVSEHWSCVIFQGEHFDGVIRCSVCRTAVELFWRLEHDGDSRDPISWLVVYPTKEAFMEALL